MKKRILLFALAAVMALGVGASAANKKPSGTLIYGEIADFNTLNPVVSEDSSETEVMSAVFDNLFRMDNKGNLRASMAVEVPTIKNGGISKDEKTYTLKMRKGIKFHDGKEATMKDLKFTIDAYLNEDVPTPSRDPYDKITKMDLVDDYTMKITLKEVVPYFLNTFALPGILPAHKFAGLTGKKLAEALGKGGDFSRHPIGTGPFEFKEWKTASYVSVEANTEYFGEGPYLKSIVFKVVPNDKTLVTQLKTGEVMMATTSATNYPAVKDIKGLKTTKDPMAAYGCITYNLKNEVLADKAVRQALAYATPRQLMIDKVANGIGKVSNSPISQLSWAYNEKLSKMYPFDLKKANEILDEAGWKKAKDGFRYKDGKKLTFTLSVHTENAGRLLQQQILQQYWKKVGVDMVPRNYEWGTLTGEIMENFKYDAYMMTWISGADPDIYSIYHSKQIPNAANNHEGQNYAQYVNPKLDTILEKAKSTSDQDVRKKYYDEAQMIVAEDLPLFVVNVPMNVNVRPDNLKNFKSSPFTNTSFWNVNEWEL